MLVCVCVLGCVLVCVCVGVCVSVCVCMCLSVCNNVCVCVSACVPRSHCLHLGACVQLPAWANRSVLLFFCCCHFISFSPSTPYCLLALTHVLSHTLSHTRALTHALSHTHTHKLSLFVPPSSGFLPTCWTVPVPLVPTVITVQVLYSTANGQEWLSGPQRACRAG